VGSSPISSAILRQALQLLLRTEGIFPSGLGLLPKALEGMRMASQFSSMDYGLVAHVILQKEARAYMNGMASIKKMKFRDWLWVNI
jgi:hypothetical protein